MNVDNVSMQMLPVPDSELVLRAQCADYKAFEELMLRYEKTIYNVAFRITHEVETAQEIVQDTFLNVFRSIKNFRQDASFKTWIYKVATNASLMSLRKGKRIRELLTDDDSWDSINTRDYKFTTWSIDPQEMFQNTELNNVVRDAISALPDIYRIAFILRDIEGLSNQETADILSITLPALKSRVLRARLQLREALSEYMEGRA